MPLERTITLIIKIPIQTIITFYKHSFSHTCILNRCLHLQSFDYCFQRMRSYHYLLASIFFQSYVRIATFKRLRNMHIISNKSKIKNYIKKNNKKCSFIYLFIYLFFSRSDLKKLILKKLRFRELPNDSSSEVLSNLGLYQLLITFNVIIMKNVCQIRQSHY